MFRNRSIPAAAAKPTQGERGFHRPGLVRSVNGTVSISLILELQAATGTLCWLASKQSVPNAKGCRVPGLARASSVPADYLRCFSSRVRRARGLKRPNQPSSWLVGTGTLGSLGCAPGSANVPRGATAATAPPAAGTHGPAAPPPRAPAGWISPAITPVPDPEPIATRLKQCRVNKGPGIPPRFTMR